MSSWHKGSRVLLAVAALAAGAPAFADTAQLPGLDAYRNGDFGSAARELKTALPSLAGEDREAALMYLSASYFASSKVHDTHEVLAQLFQEFPQAKLDPNIFDPDLIALSKRVEAEERARRAKLTPPEQSEAPPVAAVEVTEPQEQGRGPLPYVATGGAVVALGASIAFAASASRQQSDLERSFDAVGHSTLTHAQALELREGANRDMSFALASAAGTAVLTGLAIWLWTRSDP